MTRRSVLALLLCIGVLPAAPGRAYPAPGRTERASVSSQGAESDGWSGVSSVSADGRYVAFVSWGTGLVTGDTNAQPDIFVRDAFTGTTERVSAGTNGVQPDDWSWAPAMSDDGRFVGFESMASNLVPGDTNVAVDVYLRDRETGSVERISAAMDGGDPDNHSGGPRVSPDGRFVLFHSRASNLVPGDTNGDTTDVFLHDRGSGTVERVSVSTDEAQGDGLSFVGDLTPDARYIAFTSEASNLVPGDDNGADDVFVRDRIAGTTELVSAGLDGAMGDGMSMAPDISGDGRYVAFHSAAGNLVPRDTNGVNDVFVRDRLRSATERISLTSSGVQTGGYSYYPTMTDDGRFVSFTSGASTMVPGDTNFRADSFVHDRLVGVTDRISVSSDGGQGNHESTSPALSADGRFVTFTSRASNLVPGDTNASPFSADIFLRDLGPDTGVGELTASRSGNTLELSGWARFPGALAADAADPSDDAPAGSEAGTELTGADLAYRVEDESLLVRVRVLGLPTARPPGYECPLPFGQECPGLPEGATGAPGIVYGLRFTIAGSAYEARAVPIAATGASPGAPAFALYACDAVCTQVATLSGGIGTAGREVRLRIPLAAVPGAVGGGLTQMTAFSAVGEAAAPTTVALDEITLGSAAIPVPTIQIGVADQGTPDEDVSMVPAALTQGSFLGSLDVSGLSGDHHALVRACLASRCSTSSLEVHL